MYCKLGIVVHSTYEARCCEGYLMYRSVIRLHSNVQRLEIWFGWLALGCDASIIDLGMQVIDF